VGRAARAILLEILGILARFKSSAERAVASAAGASEEKIAYI
jgi:hypothetical protein